MSSSRETAGPTMASIGRAAGVSRQTVWNVLHAPHRVRPETRERVEQAIRQERYRPNRVARSLRTRTAQLIGYCVLPRCGGDLNPVEDRFLHAVTEAAEERGYHVLLFTAETGAAGLGGYAELMAEAAVDGFILSNTIADDPRQGWLRERGVPFAAFGRTWSADDALDHWVDVDNAAGTDATVAHLHRMGHRRLAFLGWAAGSTVGDDRVTGWRRACARYGIAADRIARCENSSQDSRAAAARLLDCPDPPTALVCVSDVVALGCLSELAARGLYPGRDVAVAGFDDAPFAALPGIDLTSVQQPIERAGADVVRLLVGALAGNGSDDNHILLAPSLRVRNSTSPPGDPS